VKARKALLTHRLRIDRNKALSAWLSGRLCHADITQTFFVQSVRKIYLQKSKTVELSIEFRR